MRIVFCGVGALGSTAAVSCRNLDATLRFVDFDRVESKNVLAQAFVKQSIGKNKAEVVAADIRDLPALLSALEKFNVDTLVATAGLIGGRVQENSYTGATNNILGTINVLEAARLRKLRRVVYVSTFGVYDRSKVTATIIREGDPIGGHNLYTVTKLCSEHLVHSYAEQYRLDTIIIRPGGVFGRGFYVGDTKSRRNGCVVLLVERIDLLRHVGMSFRQSIVPGGWTARHRQRSFSR